MNNLYDELKSGRSAAEIAEAFAAQLNEAEARIREEEEEARAAEAAAKAAMENADKLIVKKREAIVDLINDFFNFITTYYPSIASAEDINELDDKTIYAMADLIIMAIDLEVLKLAINPKAGTLTNVLNDNGIKIKNFCGCDCDANECTNKASKSAKPRKNEIPVDFKFSIAPSKEKDPFADFFKAFGL